MTKRLALAAVTAVASFGALAGSAAADPAGTLCGSLHVSVNGQSVIDQSQCQVLPPS
jgi:hypothetical protein